MPPALKARQKARAFISHVFVAGYLALDRKYHKTMAQLHFGLQESLPREVQSRTRGPHSAGAWCLRAPSGATALGSFGSLAAPWWVGGMKPSRKKTRYHLKVFGPLPVAKHSCLRRWRELRARRARECHHWDFERRMEMVNEV